MDAELCCGLAAEWQNTGGHDRWRPHSLVFYEFRTPDFILRSMKSEYARRVAQSFGVTVERFKSEAEMVRDKVASWIPGDFKPHFGPFEPDKIAVR